jgi:hypothetical protein
MTKYSSIYDDQNGIPSSNTNHCPSKASSDRSRTVRSCPSLELKFGAQGSLLVLCSLSSDRSMASNRGSALSLLQHTRIPPSSNVKQSRAFCGNTRHFGKIYRVPASRIRREGEATHGHGIFVSAAASSPPEPVQKEAPARQHSPASLVERWLPAPARPYALLARLDKPDAIWLYAWPCFWYVDRRSLATICWTFQSHTCTGFLCRNFFLGHST